MPLEMFSIQFGFNGGRDATDECSDVLVSTLPAQLSYLSLLVALYSMAVASGTKSLMEEN